MYYDNSNGFQKDVTNSLEDGFLDGIYDVESIQAAILDKRLSSAGNYDALFGKVVNFSWSFLEDGSYDITVILRSIGDVIESLKVNVLIDDSPTPEELKEQFIEKVVHEELRRVNPTDATSVATPNIDPSLLFNTSSVQLTQEQINSLPSVVPGT